MSAQVNAKRGIEPPAPSAALAKNQPAAAGTAEPDEKWGARFPVITQAWLNAWEHVTPFLAFPPELRRVIYTTNAIEALNRQLRKANQDQGPFPQRGGRPQTDLSRDHQRRAGVDANAELDDSVACVQNPLRRPTTRVNRLHRKSDACAQLVRTLLRRRPARWAIYSGTLVGGVLLLTAADAPESLVIGYLIALWVLYMFLLRWRSR